MRTVALHDRLQLEQILRTNPALHLYSLGDLDDFFCPHTQWYGLQNQNQILTLLQACTHIQKKTALQPWEISPPIQIFAGKAIQPI